MCDVGQVGVNLVSPGVNLVSRVGQYPYFLYFCTIPGYRVLPEVHTVQGTNTISKTY